MKKTGIFKLVMFVILALIITTWIFPASYFTNGSLSKLEMYNVGFFDFWQLLFGTFEFQYFIQIAILLLSVGALYEVLGKTGKYRAWVEKIANNFKGAEVVFLLCSAFLIAILSSVFDYGFALFIFFPFIISILLAMGYDKFTALLATFGSILIGTIGSTTGYNTAGVVNSLVGIESKSVIIYRVVLFVLALGTELFFLAKSKREKVTEKSSKEDLFLGEKNSNKYSVTAIIIIFVLLFVLLVLGCTSWVDTFKVKVFSNFHETITGIDLLSKILGTVSALGEWYYAEMSVMCILATIVIGIHYRVKDFFEVMAEGARKMLRPAFIVMIVYSVVYFAGNTMFYPTIADYLLHITKKFNIFFATISLIISSVLHVDMLYFANYTVPQLASVTNYDITVSILSQGIYGATMFIAPTSAVLALGLSYLGISYKEWVKKYWKFILSLLVLVVIASVITLFVY